MKILWVSPNFLHPTTKGGQIRTLGILKCLFRSHEVHYVALDHARDPEGPARACEYSHRCYPIPHRMVNRRSPRMLIELPAAMVSPMPFSVRQVYSLRLKECVEDLLARESFDRIVVDFLVMAASFPALERAFLFQHNVETMIWRRHAEHAKDPLRRLFLSSQERRMFDFERKACGTAAHVIAVSDTDAALMREMFGISNVSTVPTGVDVDYFTPPGQAPLVADLSFLGSMDWMANEDGVHWFVREVLPLIRERRPGTTFAIVGRIPPPGIVALGRTDPGIRVTGTVPDVRPYLWGSSVSVVPLRVGGGTRLKIYESMAAGVPVVSTGVGAEGLPVTSGDQILIGDHPQEFAAHCVELLENREAAGRIAARGRALVVENFSWEQVTGKFVEVLESGAPLRSGKAGAAAASR